MEYYVLSTQPRKQRLTSCVYLTSLCYSGT
jgi:hypothetical protein